MRLLHLAALTTILTFPTHGQDPPKPPYVPVAATHLLHITQPTYPDIAKDRAITGVIVLKVFVAPDGTVTRAEPISGPDELRQAATDAVKQWLYTPYQQEGQPISFETTASLKFVGAQEKRTGPIPSSADMVWLEQNRSHPDPVELFITVTAEGKVTALRVIGKTHDAETEVAKQVFRWNFKPATLNGVPVEGKLHIQLGP